MKSDELAMALKSMSPEQRAKALSQMSKADRAEAQVSLRDTQERLQLVYRV